MVEEPLTPPQVHSQQHVNIGCQARVSAFSCLTLPALRIMRMYSLSCLVGQPNPFQRESYHKLPQCHLVIYERTISSLNLDLFLTSRP